MANYFVDSTNTSGTYNGSSVGNAWRTIQRPLDGSDSWTSYTDTGTEVTDAGDIVWLSPDHSETWDQLALSRIIVLAGNADPSAPIIFRGDLDKEHFTGAGSGRPSVILNGSSSNAWIDFGTADRHFVFEHIDFSYTDASVPLTFMENNSCAITFKDCKFTTTGRFQLVQGGSFVMEDCEYVNELVTSPTSRTMFLLNVGTAILRGCTITGPKNVFTTSSNRQVYIEVEDTTCDSREASGGGIFSANSSYSNWQARCRNLDFGDFDLIQNQSNMFHGSKITVADYDGNERLNKDYHWNGTVEVTETGLRTGGGDSVVVAEPNANCSSTGGLRIYEVAVPAPSGVSRDYTLYMKGSGWTTLPDDTELVYEAGYYDTAEASTRTWTASTDEITTSYSAITISGISPSEDGTVILRVTLYLNDGGAGEDITVDRQPEIT